MTKMCERLPSFQCVQWRYNKFSATCAFTGFFSFSSSRFLLHASSLQSGKTEVVKRTVFPSGDHFTMSAPAESLVSGCASPPSMERTYTCESPLRAERNTMVFPSGDHFGEESFPVRVSWIASPPATGAIHKFVAFRFASLSGGATG